MLKARKSGTLAALALALVGAAFAVTASASDAHHRTTERLVVRGESTIVDSPVCPGGVCKLEFVNGTFLGTPVGTGAYDGALDLRVAEGFSNGEGGGCAPIAGRITLGAGTKNRLVLGVYGDSCQDGGGDLKTSSFTGLAGWVVKYGTGTYAKAKGRGTAVFLEDAADRDRMTLIGSISR
jgi:hypothetical protein